MTPHVADIQAAVCERYGLSHLDMVSNRNGRTFARPRQLAMYLARELTPASTTMIGELFGRRDHSTVIHACKTIAALIERDQGLAEVVAELRGRLSNPGQTMLPLNQAC